MNLCARRCYTPAVALVFLIVFMPFSSTAQNKAPRPGNGSGSTGGGSNRVIANPRLRAVLQAVVDGTKTLRLYGVRQVEQSVAGKKVLHTEFVWRSGLQSRVEFPEEPYKGQVIVDNGQTRLHYYPKRKLIKSEPAPKDSLIDRFGSLLASARLPRAAVLDGGRVAGIQTDLVDVYDRDNQISQQLWVDSRTGAVLKRIGFNRFGVRIAYVEFSRVDYRREMGDDVFVINAPGARHVTQQDDFVAHAKKVGVTPLGLPASSGYLLAGSHIQKTNGVDVLFSSYQGPRGRLTILLLRARVSPGAIQERVPAGQSTYTLQRDGITVVLVGPYLTADLISAANSLVTVQ